MEKKLSEKKQIKVVKMNLAQIRVRSCPGINRQLHVDEHRRPLLGNLSLADRKTKTSLQK